jgi:hypothetical protein
MAEEQQEVEPTVSVTFRDDQTGKNRMKIICAVTEQEKELLGKDTSGRALTKFVLERVLFQFRIKTINLEGDLSVQDKQPHVPKQ